MNAIIYARFSPRPGAALCESIEFQLERCRAYCQAMNFAVLAEFSDRELSGGRADNRPGLQDALNAACEHKAVLIVYSLSRLARNTRDAISISERLDKCGADLASLSEKIDTTSAGGRLMFTIFAGLATFEREQTAERTSQSMRRHQAAGRRMSERTPFGWVRNPQNPALMISDPMEQSIIVQIKGLNEKGFHSREICRELELMEIKCRGGRWYHGTIQNILKRLKEA